MQSPRDLERRLFAEHPTDIVLAGERLRQQLLGMSPYDRFQICDLLLTDLAIILSSSTTRLDPEIAGYAAGANRDWLLRLHEVANDLANEP